MRPAVHHDGQTLDCVLFVVRASRPPEGRVNVAKTSPSWMGESDSVSLPLCHAAITHAGAELEGHRGVRSSSLTCVPSLASSSSGSSSAVQFVGFLFME